MLFVQHRSMFSSGLLKERAWKKRLAIESNWDILNDRGHDLKKWYVTIPKNKNLSEYSFLKRERILSILLAVQLTMIGWLGNGAVLNTSSSSSVSGGGGLRGAPSCGGGGRGGACSD